jgi:flagellar export protein FliJ
MRNFHFRLDPVMRLKRHEIERREEEIQHLEMEIQTLTGEIESGRTAVQEMRRRLLEQVDDANLLEAERTMDQFRSYTTHVELQKQGQVNQLRNQQNTLRQELVKLYQDEKMLERLREKQHEDWQKEELREEAALMDEIGTQKFIRRKGEHGGVLLYLLVPFALIAAATAIGYYTGFIHEEALQNIPYLSGSIQDATVPIEVSPSSTGEENQYLTLEDFLGDPNEPMPELLQNIANLRTLIAQRTAELDERERELNLREQLLVQREQQLAGVVQQASGYLTEIRSFETQLADRQKGELSERETQVAQMLSGAKPKEISPVVTSLFQGSPVDTPEEQREKRLILLRIMHRLDDRTRAEIFSALAKDNPLIAANLIQAFSNTTMNELYGLEPPTAGGGVKQTTESVNLSPPQLIDENDNTPPADK